MRYYVFVAFFLKWNPMFLKIDAVFLFSMILRFMLKIRDVTKVVIAKANAKAKEKKFFCESEYECESERFFFCNTYERLIFTFLNFHQIKYINYIKYNKIYFCIATHK